MAGVEDTHGKLQCQPLSMCGAAIQIVQDRVMSLVLPTSEIDESQRSDAGAAPIR